MTVRTDAILLLVLSRMDVRRSKIFVRGFSDLGRSASRGTVSVLRKIHSGSIVVSSFHSLQDFCARFLPRGGTRLGSIVNKTTCIGLFRLVNDGLQGSKGIASNSIVDNGFFSLTRQVGGVVGSVHGTEASNSGAFVIVSTVEGPFRTVCFRSECSSFCLVTMSYGSSRQGHQLHKLKCASTRVGIISSRRCNGLSTAGRGTCMGRSVGTYLRQTSLRIDGPSSNGVISGFGSLTSRLLAFITLVIEPKLIAPAPLRHYVRVTCATGLGSKYVSERINTIIASIGFSMRSIN